MKRFLSVLLVLLLVCSLSFAEDAVSSATLSVEKLPQVEPADNGILVAYFSPGGDTVKASAYIIASALSADLFEIVPEEPYTADDLNYMDRKARSIVEMGDSASRPAVAGFPEDMSKYDTVFLCYPIWGGQAPKILSTFIEGVDLGGKTVIPFATSNSSGFGSSDQALQALTDSTVVWKEGKGIRKGATAEEITDWVKELGLK
jgi:flavodoxin